MWNKIGLEKHVKVELVSEEIIRYTTEFKSRYLTGNLDLFIFWMQGKGFVIEEVKVENVYF